MAQFNYKARRKNGEVINGMLDVTDRAAALGQLERQGLFPVLIELAKGSAGASNGKSERGAVKFSISGILPPALREVMARKRRPKMQELATFTVQLANLLHCGMPLTVALGSMSHLESKGIPSDVSKQLKQDVMEGKGLSDAMAKQSGIFTELYINMVRAGEQSGALEEVLRRLASHYERFASVQQKFKSALIYPAVVGCVGVCIVIFFMTFMLPKFMTIFEGMKIQLPASTQMLINMSHFFSSPTNWVIMILAIAALATMFLRFKSTPAGIRRLDGLKMNAPVIGKVMKLNLFGQFARTLSTLLQNGVPVLMALKITEQVIPNVVLKEAIAKTREAVTDGKSLAQPLAKSQVFPQLMIDLIRIGEDTGDVPGSLQNLAETYENELELGLRVVTNLIEPAMIILMAMGVGMLLFSVLSAMFAITSNIAQ